MGLERCQKCDREGVGTYFCHAGLMDFAADVVVNGEKLATILGGQVLPAPPDFDKFRQVAVEIGVDPDEYIEALKKVPVKTEKSIRAAADLMGEMINMLVNLEYFRHTFAVVAKSMQDLSSQSAVIYNDIETSVSEITHTISALSSLFSKTEDE